MKTLWRIEYANIKDGSQHQPFIKHLESKVVFPEKKKHVSFSATDLFEPFQNRPHPPKQKRRGRVCGKVWSNTEREAL